jgi:hypothetical protein
MPELISDGSTPAGQQTGSISSAMGSGRMAESSPQDFSVWAAMPQLDDDAEPTHPLVPEGLNTQRGAPDQNAATDEITNESAAEAPPASPPDKNQLRFDDLIPNPPPTLRWPGLGTVSLAPDPGTIPDIYRTDLLDRFHPFILLFGPASARRDAGAPSNPAFSQPPPPYQSPNDTAVDVWRPGVRYAADARNLAVTSDAVIDRNTEMLLDLLTASVHAMGEGVGPLFGTRVHVDFAARVKQMDLPGIGIDGVEQSFHLGEAMRYGAAGSIRTDVILRNAVGTPVAIYDLKTGNAKLTPSRIKELRDGARAPNVPIIELRFQTGTAILR